LATLIVRNQVVVEQSSRELTLAISKASTGDAALYAHPKFAEIRRRPRFRPQPFQSGTTSLLT
jgi:hypothetical protein